MKKINNISKNQLFLTFSAVTILVSVIFGVPFQTSADVNLNLIANPAFEITTPSGDPENWTRGGFGTNTTTFSYPASGFSGKGVGIEISGWQNGDAKWIFKEVPVVPGHQYTYSDKYSSNVTTELVAQYFDANHNHLFFRGFVGVVPSTDNASTTVWQSVSTDFIVPITGETPVAYMTVFHTIGSISPNNGMLSLDNVSLVEVPEPSAFSEGIVSLTFDDGWTSQYQSGFLEMKKLNMPGTYYIFTTPMHDSGKNAFLDSDATADMSTTTTTKGVTWSPIYLSGGEGLGQDYFISDNYTSNSTSTIAVTYTLGTTTTTITSEVLPAGSGLYGAMMFHLPTGINPGVIISHKTTSSSGTLTVGGDKAIEEISSDYMGPAQLREIQRGGSEIAVHTRDHCNLVYVSDPVRCAYFPATNPSTLELQINGSQSDLISLGLSPVRTLAYPYGSYNSVVTDFLKTKSSIIGARGLDIGYNYKNTNKLALKVQVIDASTTPAQVESWINTAKADHSWLILVFHQINNPATIISNGELGGTTPELFKSFIDIIHSNNISVKTVYDVVSNLMDPDPVAPDTTAPVISGTPTDNTVYTNVNAPLAVTYTTPIAADTSVPVSISCVPASGSVFAIGTTTVTCTATDSAPFPNSSTSSFNVGVVYVTQVIPQSSVIQIAPETIPNATVGIAYTATLSASTTATGPFTWSASSTLPAGLSLGVSTGVLSGTPTTSGQFNFSVGVTNGTASTTKVYTIDVIPAAVTPSGGGEVPVIKGDANKDGKIDSLDFDILMANWGKVGVNNPADFNLDGKVNVLDFVILMRSWKR